MHNRCHEGHQEGRKGLESWKIDLTPQFFAQKMSLPKDALTGFTIVNEIARGGHGLSSLNTRFLFFSFLFLFSFLLLSLPSLSVLLCLFYSSDFRSCVRGASWVKLRFCYEGFVESRE
jgi:hypothetical protein